MLFKALFWEIRLADTDLAATRSHRQIEAMALVFWCIEKKLTRALQERPFMDPFIHSPR